MQMHPYLTFDGRCEAAFNFYQKVLGGKIVMMMNHGDSPMAAQVPKEWGEKILHARLEIGDMVLMGSDSPPDYREKPQGFSVSLSMADPAEAERIFTALSEKAEVRMPLQQTFWAVRFGMLVDQFGIPWMVNCEQPQS